MGFISTSRHQWKRGHQVLSRWCMLMFFLGIAGFSLAAPAPTFEFDETTVQAYKAALRLQLDEATRLSQMAQKANNQNLAPVLVDNYIDFLTLFFHEDPAVYKAKKDNYSKRMNRLALGPSNAAMTLFSQAVVSLQWAAIKFRFGDRLGAGIAFRDAYKLAQKNQKKFPSFMPTLMITGPLQMAAGTIPQNLKWLGNLVGISGNLQTGQQYTNTFMKATDPWSRMFHEEGLFYFIYIQYHLLNQPEAALDLIRKENLDLVNNHLFTYMASNLLLNNKQSSKAQGIILNRNKSATYFQTPVWDFGMAYAKLYELNPQAEEFFNRYLKQYKGNVYLKDTWLKLGWHHLVHGNPKGYQYCMEQVKERGTTLTDADKTALKEAKSGKKPNLTLLKARLLNDGGYHQRALQMLQSQPLSTFKAPEERLEYAYRLARISDDLGQTELAIKYYTEAWQLGKNRTEYYAARASLQLGLIFERKGQKSIARQYYQQCIDLEDHDYEDSLEQKAKAGIERCR